MAFHLVPGPYKLQAGRERDTVDVIVPSQGWTRAQRLATIWSGTNPPSREQAEANARAFVESPAMAAALRYVLPVLENQRGQAISESELQDIRGILARIDGIATK